MFCVFKNCKNHFLVQQVLFKIDFKELNLKEKHYYNKNNLNRFLNDFLKYGHTTVNMTMIQTPFNKYLKPWTHLKYMNVIFSNDNL